MNKILCPIDFSEVSLNAIEFAAKLADAHHARLVLLNVFTEEDFNQILDTDTINKDYNEKLNLAEKKLKSLSEEINSSEKKNGLMGCTYIFRTGKLTEKVFEVAREEKADLIVVGTTGLTGLTEKYVGSKTLRIIEDAPCSVLVVPQDQAFHKIKRIVYATDYQEEDKIAIQQAINLATVLDASLNVLHISHSESDINNAIYNDFVEEIKSFANYKKLRVHREVFSSTTQGIKEYVHRENVDLLALLSKKRNFFENLFHHSVTKDLYAFSDFPFMVIKNG